MVRACLEICLVYGLTVAGGAQVSTQNRQITDPAEYNAYVAAFNEQAPARKIRLFDDFLAKYPNTVVKEDALELKLVAQQQAGQSFDGTARQILQVNPKNFRALVVLSFIFAQNPVNPQDPQLEQKLSEAEDLAKRGVEQVATLPKPEKVTDADYQKSKNVARATFQQVLGIVAVIREDYSGAQAALRQSGELNPDNAPVFYNLGIAYISSRPQRTSEALWAFARAIAIEGPGTNALTATGRRQLADYLKAQYKRYHGAEDGLDKLMADAKTAPFPPENFHISRSNALIADSGSMPAVQSEPQVETLAQGQSSGLLGEGRKRVALVVGNDVYQRWTPLANAVNDARAMGQALRASGFQVRILENADRERLERGVEEFLGRLGRGDVALFYYSGHALQIRGENYLAPVDLDAKDEVQARNRSYNATEILERMEITGADLQILILDACRNNPFGRGRGISRGLAPMNAGRGSFVAYATAPGMTADDNSGGQNGLYTTHLLRALGNPGLKLEEVFKKTGEAVQKASGGQQIPWTASSVAGDFYFRMPVARVPVTPPKS